MPIQRAATGAVRTLWDSGFIDAKGERKNQSNAPALIGIVAKKLGAKPETVARGIGYFDPEDRIVLKDLQNALNWYDSVGMIKQQMDPNALLDKRFVIFAE